MHHTASIIVGAAILRVKDALERRTSVTTQIVWLPARIDISHKKIVTFRLVQQHSAVREIAESALRSPCHGYVQHSTLLLVTNLYNLSKKIFELTSANKC